MIEYQVRPLTGMLAYHYFIAELIYSARMNDSEQEVASCPVDVDDCQWLDQLAQLRRENEKLKLLVTTDPLTGLFNYRYFRQMLDTAMQRTIRSSSSTCLIMADLDFFKAVNDKWGHEAGNLALQTAAGVFSRELRQSDIICRYGGEEFAFILPQTPLPIAVNVAERVRLSLERTPVEFKTGSFQLTASFGVGVYQQANDHTAESFVDAVDQLLYQAKQQGRNQVCHTDYTLISKQTAVSMDEKEALFNRRKED